MRKTILILIILFGVYGFQRLSPSGEPWPKPALKFFPPLPAEFNMPSRSQVELGRYLFYDPILSADSSLSCSSCHQQKAAFSDAGQKFSKGFKSQIQTRNTPPLFNLAWERQFFWDARSKSLTDQAFHPVRDPREMNLPWSDAVKRIRNSPFYPKLFTKAFPNMDIDSNAIVRALAAFQIILFSQDSKYDKVLRGEAYFKPEEYFGYTLVNLQNKGDCLQCHPTDQHALGTTGTIANNGLELASSKSDYSDQGAAKVDNLDRFGWFKIPSLRNLGFTAPYMHDGRFNTLEEVVEFYSEGLHQSYNADFRLQHAHKGGAKLDSVEKAAVIAFLATLNDSSFIENKHYSNPFND